MRNTGRMSVMSDQTVAPKGAADAAPKITPRTYYSKPAELDSEIERASAVMKEKEQAAKKAQYDAEQAAKDLKEKQDKLKLISGKMRTSRGQELLGQLQGEIQQGRTNVTSSVKRAQAAAAEYEPAAQKYRQSVGKYNKWRSTIRDAETVRTELTDLDGQIKTLERLTRGRSDALGQSMRASLEQLRSSRDLVQEELDWSEHFYYADMTGNDDYKELSRYNTTANGRAAAQALGGMYAETGFDNVIYDYINRNADAAKVQRQQNLVQDYSHLEQMTDDEVGIYNYLYAKEGAQSASKYLDHLKGKLTSRQREKLEETMAKQSRDNPLLASMLSAGLAPVKGLGAIGQAVDYLADGEIDENAGYNRVSHMSSAIRGEVGSLVESKWGKVGSAAYQLGMSMADSLANGVAGRLLGSGAAAKLILGSGVAADVTIESKDRGLSSGQAIKLGTVAGVAEALMESIGIDELLHMKAIGKGRLWKSMASEGLEELGTDVINTAFDAIISKEESQWNQSIQGYMANGESREKAEKLTLRDTLMQWGGDFLGGAVSGGVFGGIDLLTGRGNKAPDADARSEQTAPQTVKTTPEAEQMGQMPEQNPVNAEQAHAAVNREPAMPMGAYSGGESSLQQIKEQTIVAMSPRLKTLEEQAYLRRLEAAKTDLEISGVLTGAEDEKIQTAQRLANLLGKRILFEPADKARNGWYVRSEDTIYLNPKSGDPVAQVIGHELTHSIEVSSEDYGTLQRLVTERIGKTGGDMSAMRKQKIDLYAQNNVTISEAQADREIVAEYVEKHLLTDEQAIREMVRDDRSLARRILDWLDGLLLKFTKRSQERQFVLQARDAYRRALQDSYKIHESNRLQRAGIQAYAEEDDVSGDALFDERWGSDGYVDRLLEDDDVAGIEFSFAGESAEGADREALRQARQMEAQGVEAETIRQNTGWFRSMDGKWRWEIDDSAMRYYRGGDAQFRKDHPDYSRYRDLELKFLEGTITQAEMVEMQELGFVWNGEHKRLAERVSRGNAILANVLDHDALFEQYPQLRRVRVRFGDTDNAGGWWDKGRNEIVLSDRYRDADSGFLEMKLLHEIQHAIQDIEGFANGANPEYWEEYQRTNKPIRKNDRQLERAYREAEAALNSVPKEVQRDFWYAANMVEQDPEEALRLGDMLSEGEYADAFDDYSWAIWTIQELEADNPVRSGRSLYIDTAGEIEARNSERRMNLDFQGRKNTPPNLGDENTVFADRPTHAEDYIPGDISEEEINGGIEKAAGMEPVAVIRQPRFKKAEGNLLRSVSEFFSSIGNVATNPRLGDVRLTKRGVKDNLAHGMSEEKAISFEAIPAVLENGAVVGFEKNWKGRGYDSATVAAPIMIGKDAYMMGVVVHRGNGENRFYIHDVFAIKEEAVPFITGTTKSGTPGGTTSTLSVIQKIMEVKRNVGKRIADKQFSISEETSTAEQNDPVAALPWKAQSNLKTIERKLVNGVANSLNVPYQGKREFLQPIVREISQEFLRSGMVSQETADRLFEEAYEQGRLINAEFCIMYRDVKDYLEGIILTLNERDRADIPEFDKFKKRARDVLKIRDEGGVSVDKVWAKLQEMAPERFPSEIVYPSDRIREMLAVGRAIKRAEKALEWYSSEDADNRKIFIKGQFNTAVGEAVAELRKVKRYDEAAKASQEEQTRTELTQEEVTALYPKLKETRRNYEKVMAKNLLTQEDQKQVSRLLRGDIGLEHLKPERDNVEGITAVYEAKLEYEKYAQQIRQWNRSRKAKLMAEAAQFTESANSWKDKAKGILYSRETMERNIRDIVPNKELAERIIDTYFKPVHDAAAQANRTKNKYRDRIRALNISRKAEGDHVSEAYAVQLLGEAEDNIRVMRESRGRIKTRDGRTIDEWQAVINEMWQENPQLDQVKIRKAVEEFRKIYNELFEQMNEARVRNGYEPVNYRQGYFPHFQAKDEEGVMALFGKALGIKTEVTALPTSINGLTHTFKPGIRWMGNALERKGFETAYDALEGFDRYIEGVADVIHQTDNIQRLRALAAQARYRSTDEGIRRQIDDIRARDDLSEIDKENRIKEIYENARFALSNFVVELDEYTNLLANKKSRADRNMEQAMGRDTYNLVKAWESRVAANMVAINPGSWITNFIPLQQGAATLDSGLIWKGMLDTLKAIKNDDGFVDSSSFLINRRGSDPLVQTPTQKASAWLSHPMEAIDAFTADSLVRARFMQNVNRGLSEAAAIDEADQWAAGVMADRSKGATPTLFNRSNPLTKMFTQFQLEVNNQLSYVAKDIPREAGMRDKYLAALAAMLFKFMIGAYLANDVYEEINGRRPALDLLGILNDTVGDITGFEMPNVIEFINGEDRDFQTEKVGLSKALGNLGGNVLEQMPFTAALSMFGLDIDAGRVPVAGALPDLVALKDAATNTEWSKERRIDTAKDELDNFVTYNLLPFGGSQVKKIIQGFKAVRDRGSYSVNTDGEEQLQYPIHYSNGMEMLLAYAKAMTLGKSAFDTAQEWVDSGFSGLGAKQTAAYKGMIEAGEDGEVAYDLIVQIKEAAKTEDESKSRQQRRILQESELSPESKAIVFYQMMASEKELDLMDQLNEADADMGEVADVLMRIKDADSTRGKRAAILNADLDEEEKILIYTDRISNTKGDLIQSFSEQAMGFDEFLTVQNMYTEIDELDVPANQKATAFSSWINRQGYDPEQGELIRDSFKYWMQTPAEATVYDRGIEYGLTDEVSKELADTLSSLEPEEGEDSVTAVQKWRAACQLSEDPQEQMNALKTVMKADSPSYRNLAIAYEHDVEPMAFVRMKEILPQFDENGNGSYTGDEVRQAIESMSTTGLVLPGGDGTIFFLTNDQKAALWQLFSTSKSAKNNPYDSDIGWAVLDAKQAE